MRQMLSSVMRLLDRIKSAANNNLNTTKWHLEKKYLNLNLGWEAYLHNRLESCQI